MYQVYFFWWELTISVLARLYMKLNIIPSIVVSSPYRCSGEWNPFYVNIKAN